MACWPPAGVDPPIGSASKAKDDMLNPMRALRHHRASTPLALLAPVLIASPDVALVVYARDCVLSGHLPLPAERLSDHLNDQDTFELLDVVAEDLTGAMPIQTHAVEVARDEILLVHGGGPRGNAGRRVRTRQHGIVVRTGPYEVRGYIHTKPGGDPLTSLRRGKPMLALTDATIEFVGGSGPQIRRVGVVIVNRDAVDSIVDGAGEDVTLPDMPVDHTGLLLKDFTGDVHAFADAS